MSRVPLLMVIASLLSVRGAQAAPTTPPAPAEGWQRSFDPAALAPLVMPGRPRVTLVAAGELSPVLEAARGALLAAMRASGHWTVVDGDLVRDNDPDLKDSWIVKFEREARDVDAVWVLRLEEPDPAVVVLAIYSPVGAPLQTVYATEGERMSVAVAAPDIEAEYLLLRVSPVVDDRIVTSPPPESFGADDGFAKDGLQLESARELYMAIARYDLLREHDSVAEDRFTATLISGSAIFVGAVLLMQDVFDDGGVPAWNIGALGITGITLGGLGVVGLVIARLIDPDPLDHAGKVEAVMKYNANVRQKLYPATSFGVSPLSDGLVLTLGGGF